MKKPIDPNFVRRNTERSNHIDINAFTFTFTGNHAELEKILQLLNEGKSFQLIEKGNKGPVFISSYLAMYEAGQLLIHNSIAEFQYSLSMNCMFWNEVRELNNEEQKLLMHKIAKENIK